MTVHDGSSSGVAALEDTGYRQRCRDGDEREGGFTDHESGEPMIALEDVAVSFGDQAVLEGVDLAVGRGEVVGLIGPNGSGKTTLIRTISGVLQPDDGRVVVDGTPIHELSSRAASRLIAVVPQRTTLEFAFDVRQIVEMGRTPHRGRFEAPTPHDLGMVERALEATNVADMAGRSIDEVSGGERQRVLLARAIAQETPAVLLDEPTASLDINHQVETLELVRSLVGTDRAVLAAIHDLNLAARFCDRLVLLGDGAVVARGPPETVLAPDRLETVFDTWTTVARNPVTNTPSVTAHARGRAEHWSDGSHPSTMDDPPD